MAVHAFVKGLYRFPNILETTDRTFQHINNVGSFATDVAKDVVGPACCLACKCWCMLQLLAGFTAFVSAWTAFTSGCNWVWYLRSYKEIFQTGFLNAITGGLGNILNSFVLFSTTFQCSRMMFDTFFKDGWKERTHGTLLCLFFSLYCNSSFLDIFSALLKLFLMSWCLYPLFFKRLQSCPRRLFVFSGVEHIRLILRAWLYGMPLVQCFGWQLLGDKYWWVSVGLL